MKIRFEKVKNCLVVYPEGQIDHHTSEEMRQEVDKQFKMSLAKNIVFDFNDITFMDSSGIGMLIGRYKSAHLMGGRIAVTGVNSDLKKIFTLSGLGRIIKLFPNVNDAVENI